jgi:hypothetical protein
MRVTLVAQPYQSQTKIFVPNVTQELVAADLTKVLTTSTNKQLTFSAAFFLFVKEPYLNMS